MADASGTGGTSFIPKNANRVRRPRVSKRIYIFSYISYVFFFGTLLAVVGTYLYSVQMRNALTEQREVLAAERAKFNESDIAQIRELEKRILLAERLLNESSAPSRIFSAIESVIVDTMHLNELNYVREDDNSYTLTFVGAVDTFDSAMFQRDLFATVPLLASAVVSEFSYGTTEDSEGGESVATEDGTISVTFESKAHTSLFPYEPVLEEDEEIATEATSTVDDVGSGQQ